MSRTQILIAITPPRLIFRNVLWGSATPQALGKDSEPVICLKLEMCPTDFLSQGRIQYGNSPNSATAPGFSGLAGYEWGSHYTCESSV